MTDRPFHCISCRDDWSYHFRRCPYDDCGGLVDDDCVPPHCCNCSRELPDGPDGPMARPAPAGHVWQRDVPRSGEGVEAPPEAEAALLDAIRRREQPH